MHLHGVDVCKLINLAGMEFPADYQIEKDCSLIKMSLTYIGVRKVRQYVNLNYYESKIRV